MEAKYVYFTKDGKWFENQNDAKLQEEKLDIVEWIQSELNFDAAHLYNIIELLQTRYELKERWDYELNFWYLAPDEVLPEINQEIVFDEYSDLFDEGPKLFKVNPSESFDEEF